MLRKFMFNKEEGAGGGGGGGKEEGAGGEGKEKVAGEEGAGAEKVEGDGKDDEGTGDDEMTFFEEEDGDDKGGDKKTVTPTLNFSKYKDVFDEDIADEETFSTKVRGLKSENENLKILALGAEAIDGDKEIKNYRGLLQENNETLAYLTILNDYLEADIPKAQAEARAKSEVDEMAAAEGGDKQLEKIALQTKKFLKGSIKDREAKIKETIANAKKAVNFQTSDSKVISKSKDEVAKLDSFIGFKIPADTKGKLVKQVQEYIGSDQEAKDLMDPTVRAKFAMFRVHEAQWEKNVQARKGGAKQQVIKKAIEHPKVEKGKSFQKPVIKNTGQGTGRVMKNPGAFLNKA